MIVATIGHVDHGKTTLVKALTGVDTDRLPEEKARGMSIDLGFAYKRGPGGRWMVFVDVPGHERFIRNMVAGVCGIDLALIIVAADDGVMPQTREHLAILDLLGLSRGAVVVTKADRVDLRRVEQVFDEVRGILAGTLLADVPCFRTAPARGDGIPALLRFLEAQLLQTSMRAECPGPARLAIDRAFTVVGSGTVVTGTIFDGQMAVGDELVVSPAGLPTRVRRIRVRDEEVPRAITGERCALNLAGIDLEHVMRGHWVLSAELHQPTTLLDVKVRLLPDAGKALHARQQLQLHLGTANVPARAAPAPGPGLAPGATSLARLSLDSPIGALRGDRFIVRDPSTHRTIGGGVVLDPFAPRERSKTSLRIARLRALDQETPERVLCELAAQEPGFVDLGWLRTAFKLTPEEAQRVVERAGLVRLGRVGEAVMSQDRLEELGGNVVAMLASHRREPLACKGHDIAKIAQAIAPSVPAHCFQAVLDSLVDKGLARVEGSRIWLAAHEAVCGRAEQALWDRIHPKLRRCGFASPRVGELARRLGLEKAVLLRLMHHKVGQGELLKIGEDRFMPRQTMFRLARIAARVAKAQPDERFTAAQFRDAVGAGRALAIGILECLDRQRATVRSGDFRRMSGNGPGLLVGAGTPAERRPHNWRHRHRFGIGTLRK